MAIISDESFKKLKPEEQKGLKEYYKDGLSYPNDLKQSTDTIEFIFGKENLQSTCNVWSELINNHPGYTADIDVMIKSISFAGGSVFKKLIATYKISKIVTLGYGGLLNDKEVRELLPLWIVQCDYEGKVFVEKYKGVVIDKLLTFRTKELAEKFISFKENVDLVKLYYMI